jgi:2,3-dihydroxy-p-cumate/2,3-dihydroxybenzoate 3,4-dioxygenase
VPPRLRRHAHRRAEHVPLNLYRGQRHSPNRSADLAKIQRSATSSGRHPYDEANAFFRDVLGFAKSDSLGEGITFYRAFPNPYHHGIGIARSPRNQFHHLNFMVTEIDDVGRGLARFKAKDVPVYGPGAIRHRPACSCISSIPTA